MVNPAFLFALLFSASLAAQKQGEPFISKAPSVIGESVKMHSRVLDEERTLNIYLPPGYAEDSLKKYPVIYLLDGSADEDFIHIVGIVQFATFPWVEMLPESIVVGIANVDRRRDFTFPTRNEKDKADFPTTGGSAGFIRFLETELQPFIADRYRTDSVKTLIGQSLGGLLAAEALLKKPDLFTHYLIVSPSLWWDDESLLETVAQTGASKPSVYVGVGKEGEVMERTARALADKLRREGVTTIFDYFDDQDHANILHLAAYRALEQLFKKGTAEK